VADRTKQRQSRPGITHHPLDAEWDRQEKVHPTEEAESHPEEMSAASRKGHRLSRQPGRNRTPEKDGGLARKSSKGGKTRGSRAGLLSASRKAEL
jgi:hypothetical protein